MSNKIGVDYTPTIDDYMGAYTMEMIQQYPRLVTWKVLRNDPKGNIENLHDIMWMVTTNPEELTVENFCDFVTAATASQLAIAGF